MSAKPQTPPATIKAGEFKAKCLELMDRVAETGQSIVITKRGRPVARLVPALVPPESVFGFAEGLIEITGDIVSPLEGDFRVREARIAALTDHGRKRVRR